MQKANIKKNFFYQLLYESAIILLPLLTSPYTARILGAECLGVYSYYYSIVYYFQLVCMLGIKYHGPRTIAAAKDDKENLNKDFSNLLAIHAIISVIVLGIYVLYCLFIVKDNIKISIILGLNVIAAMLDINWFFYGIENFKVTVVRNLIVKVLTAICIFIFVKNPNDLWKYTLIMSLGLTISQSLVWLFIHRYIDKFVKPTPNEMLKHLKPLLLLFVPILAVSIFKYMDKVMLGSFSTKIQVGFYENAEKTISIPSTIIVSFGTIMLPRISSLTENKDRKTSEMYTRISFKYVLCLAIGMCAGLYAISDVFSIVFWGQEFSYCSNLIKILALSIPFTAYANIIRTQFLMPYKRDRIYLIAMGLGATVNFILNYVFIRVGQSVGVAFATLISEIFVTLLQSILTRKELNHGKYIKSFLFFVVVGVAMCLAVMTITNILRLSVVNLFIEIIAGILIYGAICGIYLILTKDEIVMKIINKRKE